MTQITVGIRELKTHLSRYVQHVKSGGTLVITERGKAVGRMAPINPSLEERMQELVQAKMVAWNKQKLSPMTPVTRIQGTKTVAELLLEDRE